MAATCVSSLGLGSGAEWDGTHVYITGIYDTDVRDSRREIYLSRPAEFAGNMWLVTAGTTEGRRPVPVLDKGQRLFLLLGIESAKHGGVISIFESKSFPCGKRSDILYSVGPPSNPN